MAWFTHIKYDLGYNFDVHCCCPWRVPPWEAVDTFAPGGSWHKLTHQWGGSPLLTSTMPQKSAAEALSPQNTDHPSCLFVNQLPVLNAHAILKGDFCKKNMELLILVLISMLMTICSILKLYFLL